MKEEIKNAKIEDNMLGFEVHGARIGMLTLDHGDSGRQGFVGFYLGKQAPDDWIRKILNVVGVNSLEKLKGKNVRVKIQDGRIVAIGNILKDEWFNPKEYWAK